MLIGVRIIKEMPGSVASGTRRTFELHSLVLGFRGFLPVVLTYDDNI